MKTDNERFVVYIEQEEPAQIEFVELILKRTLARRGFGMLIAESSSDGLDLIRRYNPDLVLVGVATDSRWSLEHCEPLVRLKADDELQLLPVIAVAARRQSFDTIIGPDTWSPPRGSHWTDDVIVAWGPRELVAAVNTVLEEIGARR